uniref:Putative secreted protein n=1 Tax=Ixodes ricinus TaxID=34613 RepID=A0A6B0US60_IXORI
MSRALRTPATAATFFSSQTRALASLCRYTLSSPKTFTSAMCWTHSSQPFSTFDNVGNSLPSAKSSNGRYLLLFCISANAKNNGSIGVTMYNEPSDSTVSPRNHDLNFSLNFVISKYCPASLLMKSAGAPVFG